MIDSYDGNWLSPGEIIVGRKPSTQQIDLFKKIGVRSVITLLEEIDYDLMLFYRNLNLEVLHIPVADYGLLTTAQGSAAIAFLRASPKVSLIHCYAGIGRAGSLGVLWSGLFGKYKHLSPEKVIDSYRREIRYCFDTPEQVNWIRDFIQKLRGEFEFF